MANKKDYSAAADHAFSEGATIQKLEIEILHYLERVAFYASIARDMRDFHDLTGFMHGVEEAIANARKAATAVTKLKDAKKAVK